MSRQEILDRFRHQVAAGTPIIGGGAGTGITAKSAEAGGIDLLVIYNSGRFRMAGRGSLSGLLAYGDANEIVMDMAREVLPVVRHTPVLAGVNGTDPFRSMPRFLQQVKDAGFAGVQNFPTVGLIDGTFRANLEETGMSYGLEVDMVKAAHELDLITSPYVFDVEQARDMARAGADILVPHMGLTTSGTIGAQTAMSLSDAAVKVQELADAARSVNPDILCLCHGGPIAEPSDAQYILDHTDGIVGFYGASSIERFPAETGIRRQTEDFKSVTFRLD
ncbi:phosphoenolpyruvate hydrolase family protein [Corynebacterium kalidii]